MQQGLTGAVNSLSLCTHSQSHPVRDLDTQGYCAVQSGCSIHHTLELLSEELGWGKELFYCFYKGEIKLVQRTEMTYPISCQILYFPQSFFSSVCCGKRNTSQVHIWHPSEFSGVHASLLCSTRNKSPVLRPLGFQQVVFANLDYKHRAG